MKPRFGWPTMRQDELGVLGSEFNAMLDRIEDLIARQYRAELQMNDAKYKALQMQVNPHFLYNTLDTMSAIAMTRGCPVVSTLCQALSALFRYSLNMDEPLATVSEELRHLKNYLFVMNVRTQNGLHLTLDIPQEALEVRVAKAVAPAAGGERRQSRPARQARRKAHCLEGAVRAGPPLYHRGGQRRGHGRSDHRLGPDLRSRQHSGQPLHRPAQHQRTGEAALWRKVRAEHRKPRRRGVQSYPVYSHKGERACMRRFCPC